MEIKGGCLCGAVRYTAEADPTSATVCHCRDCQKFTGSAFATLVHKAACSMAAPGTNIQCLWPRSRSTARPPGLSDQVAQKFGCWLDASDQEIIAGASARYVKQVP